MSPAVRRPSAAVADTGRLLDAVGLALGAALIVWISGAVNSVGGDGVPMAALVAASFVVFVCSRRVARTQPALVPLVVGVGGALLLLLPDLGHVVGTRAAGRPYGPLVYANATGALYLIVGLASSSIALGARRSGTRVVASLSALAFVAVALASGSAAVPFLGGVALALVVARVSSPGSPVGHLGAVVVAGAVATTVALGAAYSPTGSTGDGAEFGHVLLTERRLSLWHESLQMVAAAPLWGVGPGRFAESSVTAQADRDVFTPHHGYLLVASELGVVGGALVLGLLAWGFAVLARSTRPRDAAVGVAALTVVGTHAAVDYVARSPVVVLAAVALVAAGAVRDRREDPVSRA
ncbi:MAG: O-antigen ligase family protein [Nitriliruptorales bacterium]|nr:O-antigen ligase family protein [Nitriliruptorales bacterium]